MDLDAYMRGRRYRALIDFIDQLPVASRTWSVMLNDDEVADMIVASEQARTEENGAPSTPTGPPLWEDTPEVRMLRQLVNDFRGAFGGKGVKTIPGPRTRLDEARRRWHQRKADEIMRQVAPGAN